MKRIAVVGGGITGLTAAFQLKQAGIEPLVFEAGQGPGGAIQTHARNGYIVEAGPNSLQETPELTELITALGLNDEVVEASREAMNRYIVRDSRLVALPTSPPALIRSPILSMKGKLRILKEPYVGPGEAEESLASFVRRRLGPEVLDYLVNPFVGGIFAGDPEKLSTRHALPKLFALEKDHGSLFRGMIAAIKAKRSASHSAGADGKSARKRSAPRLLSFRDGLRALPGGLAAQLQKRVYFETTVESITEKEGRWELIATRYGRQLRDTYHAVVLALPAEALAGLAFANKTGPTSLKILGEIPHPPVTTVSFGFKREQVRHPLGGFGMLIPEKERRQILGTLFSSSLFPGRAPAGHVLLTSFVGGSRQPDLARQPEEVLRRIVLEDLRSLLGVTGEPDFQFTRLWPRAIPQYEVGHGRFLQAIDDFEQDHPGLFIGGTARDGISVGQCIASGYRHSDRVKKFIG